MKVTVGGPGPGARFKHTMTAIGTSIFVFGGLNRYATLTKNEVWAFDIKSSVYIARLRLSLHHPAITHPDGSCQLSDLEID
jgi:hypothetical protein